MMSRRFLPVLALALAIAPRLAAQDPIFRFSANTDESVPVGDLTGPTDIQVRPNTARELNLFVLNPADDPHEMRVQMLDAKGKVVAETKLRAAKKSYARVKLTKPPMPAAVPALAPVPPMPTPAPMGPPAPPGTELGTDAADGTRTFEFKLRLYDDTAIEDELPKAKVANKNTTRDEVAAKLAKTQVVVVSILDPATYIKLIGTPKYKNSAGDTLFVVNVQVDAKFLAGAPCLVELVFPPQPNLNVAVLGAGVYRKTVTEADQKAKLYASNLPLRAGSDKDNETVYLNVDGVPRVYTFRPNLRAEKKELTDVVEPVEAAVRLIEDGKKEPPKEYFVSMPKDRYPVRVEVDASVSRFALKLTQTNGELVETVTRPSARHERVWVDATGETGAFRVESRIADWVVPLDTRDMRGTFTLTATLTGDATAKPFTRQLILDDTPPPVEEIKIEGLPAKQMRGKPMKLKVFAKDPESPIVKVIAFFGKPAPDGKLPEGPGVIVATPPLPEARGTAWVVDLPVPPDKKGGKEAVTVAVTNAVDLTTVKTIEIQLIDPPVGGKIKGVVKLGEFGKGQDGVPVILKDGDGKEKDATKTNTKGEYEFTEVAPGAYKVSAAKSDSAFGTKGETPVRVKAGDPPSTADIVLTRKP